MTDDARRRPGASRRRGDASCSALIDRLEELLERSELTELEVEAGGTALVLRKPDARWRRPPPRRRSRPAPRRPTTARGQRAVDRRPRSGGDRARPSIGPADRRFLRLAVAGAAPYVRSAARSPSARSSG